MEIFLQNSETISTIIRSWYFWAVCLIFILLWFLAIKKIFFKYPRRISKIELPTQYGTVSISVNAVAHLVKKEINTIGELKLKRVYLYQTKISYFLFVKLMISSHIEQNLVALMEKLQENILNALNERYGITNIEAVHVHIIGEPE